MKIVNIGGAINSGKSTVAGILTEKLKNAVFIEVDDLLSDEEAALFPDFWARIEAVSYTHLTLPTNSRG